METVDRTSGLTSEALIHQRQAEFLRQISSAGASLIEVLPCLPPESHKIIWSQLPSVKFEIFISRVGVAGVFPSFHRIAGPQDVNELGAEASTVEMHNSSSVTSNNPTLITPGQSLGSLLWEPSDLKSLSKILQGNIVKQSMLDTSKQAAMHLQDGLLTLLKSLDFHAAFGALDGLIVDYQPFREQVMKLIECAASLSKIETSIKNGWSSQEVVDWYNHKKLQLEAISHLHFETSTTLKASNEQLQSLQKEVSCLKDTLFHKEVELSCVVAENNEIRTRFDQISKDKLQSELDLQVKFEEAEKALKLCQQREAERNLAKISFEEARSKLRQKCNLSLLM